VSEVVSFKSVSDRETMSLQVTPNYDTKLIPTDQLVFYEDNVNEMTEEEFGKLRQNIAGAKKVPPIENLIVKKLAEKKYLVVGGNQKGRAIVESKKSPVVPCQVWDIPDDEVSVVALMLNTHGKPNPVLMFRLFAKEKAKGLTDTEIAKKFSQHLPMTREKVEEYLRLGALDEGVLAYVRANGQRTSEWDGFTLYHFKLLASFPQEEQLSVAKQVCANRMSSSDLRKLYEMDRHRRDVLSDPIYHDADARNEFNGEALEALVPAGSRASGIDTSASSALLGHDKGTAEVSGSYTTPWAEAEDGTRNTPTLNRYHDDDGDKEQELDGKDLRRQVRRGEVPAEYAIEATCSANPKIRHTYSVNILTRKTQVLEFDEKSGTFKVKEVNVTVRPLSEYLKHPS